MKTAPSGNPTRVVSLWLPNFAIDRLATAPSPDAGRPARVTVVHEQNTLRIAAADGTLAVQGVLPGMPLTDVRAVVPDIAVAFADPAADRATLDRLADWCTRYTPWVATDEWAGAAGAGLWLDVSGCAHLFGGEQSLLEDLVARLRRRGFAARAAVADTPGAAWAAARYTTPAPTVVPPGALRTCLAPLPVAALRLAPEIVAGLERLGLRRAGDLFDLPRGPLVTRFGDLLIARVDQALGRVREPVSPRQPSAPFREVLAFAEPIGRLDDVAEAAKRLLTRLCYALQQADRGLRRLVLFCYRVDGERLAVRIGTSAPARTPAHLFRLLDEHLAGLDFGFGLDAVALEAPLTEPLAAQQLPLGRKRGRSAMPLDGLVDRLANRLGSEGVVRLAPAASHVPERAAVALPVLRQGEPGGPARRAQMVPWFANRARPPALLSRPEPIEVVAPVPDQPPLLFRWRKVLHRVQAAEGPERIAPEWWRPASAQPDTGETRDYFRVEDEAGARFWLFRNGLYTPDRAAPPRWYLHGLFP
jgi:protein ImuB